MRLLFGNQPFVLPTPDLEAALRPWWERHAPALWTHTGWDTRGIDHLPLPPRPKQTPARLNTLVWPSGASRWGVFHGLMADPQLSLLRGTLAGGVTAALRVESTPSPVSGLTTDLVHAVMHLLDVRPVFVQGGDGQRLWWLTLVDDRYYWWQRENKYLFSPGDTWGDLLVSLVASCTDAAASVNPTPPVYGVPWPSRWWAPGCPLPLLLDAAAAQVGLRPVVAMDGSTVGFPTAREALAADAQRWAGVSGFVTLGGRGTVAVGTTTTTPAGPVFPTTTPGAGLAPVPYPQYDATRGNAPANYAVGFPGDTQQITTGTLASLTLPEYGGSAGVANAWAWLRADVRAGTSLGTREEYAKQLATDYYLWALSPTDATFRSIQPILPAGTEDRVEWEYAALPEFPPPPPTPLELADGPPAPPAPRILTRVVPTDRADRSLYGDRPPPGYTYPVVLTGTNGVGWRAVIRVTNQYTTPGPWPTTTTPSPLDPTTTTTTPSGPTTTTAGPPCVVDGMTLGYGADDYVLFPDCCTDPPPAVGDRGIAVPDALVSGRWVFVRTAAACTTTAGPTTTSTTTTSTTTTTTTTIGPPACGGACRWDWNTGTKSWGLSSSTCGTGCKCQAPNWCPPDPAAATCYTAACGYYTQDQSPVICPDSTATTTTPSGGCPTTTTTTPSQCLGTTCIFFAHPVYGWQTIENPCNAPSNSCEQGCYPCPGPPGDPRDCSVFVSTCGPPPPCPKPSCQGYCAWTWIPTTEYTVEHWEYDPRFSSPCAGYWPVPPQTPPAPGCYCDSPKMPDLDAPKPLCGAGTSTPCYFHYPPPVPPCQPNPLTTTTTVGPGCSGTCVYRADGSGGWTQLLPCPPGCVCSAPVGTSVTACETQIQSCSGYVFPTTSTTTSTTTTTTTTTTAGPCQNTCTWNCPNDGRICANGYGWVFVNSSCVGDCLCPAPAVGQVGFSNSFIGVRCTNDPGPSTTTAGPCGTCLAVCTKPAGCTDAGGGYVSDGAPAVVLPSGWTVYTYCYAGSGCKCPAPAGSGTYLQQIVGSCGGAPTTTAGPTTTTTAGPTTTTSTTSTTTTPGGVPCATGYTYTDFDGTDVLLGGPSTWTGGFSGLTTDGSGNWVLVNYNSAVTYTLSGSATGVGTYTRESGDGPDTVDVTCYVEPPPPTFCDTYTAAGYGSTAHGGAGSGTENWNGDFAISYNRPDFPGQWLLYDLDNPGGGKWSGLFLPADPDWDGTGCMTFDKFAGLGPGTVEICCGGA